MSSSPPGDAHGSLAASHWPVPPPDPILGPDDVHVWVLSLDLDAAERTRLAVLLSPDERERAARLHFARDRDRWIAGRGRLRQLLARYVRRDPATLTIGYACACGDPACQHPHRKPILPDDPWLQFNLSHTAGLALIAVARERRVGIDLERRLPAEEIIPLARSFCSPAELAALRTLSPDAQADALTALWVHKEAFLKARGIGLIQPPQEIEYTLSPAHTPRLSAIAGATEEATRWSVLTLPPISGHAAALLVEGPAPSVHSWQRQAEDISPS